MKRSPSPTPPSDTPSPPPSPTKKPKLSTPTPTVKTGQNTPTKATKSPKKEGSASKGLENGIKAALAEEIVLLGLKHLDVAATAAKYRMTKAQVTNQITPDRSNLRSKLVKFAQEQ